MKRSPTPSSLRQAAIILSDELHNAEQNGVTWPRYVDRAWLLLSSEIEKTAPSETVACPECGNAPGVPCGLKFLAKHCPRLAPPSAIEPSNDPRLTASPPHSAEFTVHEAPYAAAILATEKGLTPTGQHIADCERDAARYRFIRAEACKSYEEETESTTPESLYAWGFLLEGGQEPLDMDAAFDAAMKQEGK